MKKSACFAFGWLTVFSITCAWPAYAADQDNFELVKTVVVSRHGVRSPTQSVEQLETWSPRQWPRWDVPRGFLTERGYQLIKETWEQNAKSSTFAYVGCPPEGDVAIIADVDERTIQTGRALSEGLYPECNIPVMVTHQKYSDVFSPLKAKVCKIQNRQALEKRLNDGLSTLVADYRPQLKAISQIAQSNFLTGARAEVGKYKVKLSGMSANAATLTEIFALEWGQWPGQNAGWGEVSYSTLQYLMPFRVAVFSAVNRDPTVAAYKGSSIVQTILQTLASEGGAKHTFLIGHDTNLANIGALLDLNWHLPNRAANENTPGGYLKFEKWRNKSDGQDEIRVYYAALSPQQIHAEKVTEPPVEQSLLPAHTPFVKWRKLYTRRLLPQCLPQNR